MANGSNVGKKVNLVRGSSSDTLEQIENLQAPARGSATNLVW